MLVSGGKCSKDDRHRMDLEWSIKEILKMEPVQYLKT